jgi:transcriptional regulator with XRE-family HTH domain
MIIKKMPCALRTHRRSWGLSQRELADLLGFDSPAHISRIEHGKRNPGLETALACCALFGVPLHELFPQLVVEIEETFRKRASRLHEGLSQATHLLGSRKRELLSHALSGAIEKSQSTCV